MDTAHDDHVPHHAAEEEEDAVSLLSLPKRRKRDANSFRKAPQAPKRFKSSYICFFMAKQAEIKAALAEEATVTAISKRSAELWKHLPVEERAHWDDMATKDKERYMMEKSNYTGPWQVPWKRAKKDPSAPKRPMSAFLYFSQGKRGKLKQENPALKNTEISRLLGELWRSATDEEKDPFIQQERAQREIYKVNMAEWKTEDAAKKEAQRKATLEQEASARESVQGVNMLQPSPYGEPLPYGHAMHMPSYSYMPQTHAYPYGGFPIGPYAFPTDGKQPVILGPSGTPVYPNYNASQGAPADGGTGAAAHYSEGLTAPDGSHFEYSDPV